MLFFAFRDCNGFEGTGLSVVAMLHVLELMVLHVDCLKLIVKCIQLVAQLLYKWMALNLCSGSLLELLLLMAHCNMQWIRGQHCIDARLRVQ